MKYQNRRVQAQEAALERKRAAVEALRLASTREETDKALAEMLAAKEQEFRAERLPAAEFLCGGCGNVERSLERELITVVGYTRKDAQGEIVAMESFEPARQITICSECAAACGLGDYLHFDKFPTPKQLKAFRGEAKSSPPSKRTKAKG